MLDYKDILYQKDGAIATITINRPEKRNSLTTETYAEIAQALDEAVKYAAVRVAVLTGAGDRVFASGQDLRFTLQSSPAQFRENLEQNNATRDTIRFLDT